MSEHISCISVIAVDRNASVCGEIVHRGGGEVYQCREAAGVYYGTRLKGLVHFQIQISWYFTHPPCHPRCLCISFFSRKEIKVFDENILGFVSI